LASACFRPACGRSRATPPNTESRRAGNFERSATPFLPLIANTAVARASAGRGTCGKCRTSNRMATAANATLGRKISRHPKLPVTSSHKTSPTAVAIEHDRDPHHRPAPLRQGHQHVDARAPPHRQPRALNRPPQRQSPDIRRQGRIRRRQLRRSWPTR
jgi:hypothetical protein